MWTITLKQATGGDHVAEVGHMREDFKMVRHAACEGLADGLRQHLPGGVGIVVKGGATCGLCAIVHFSLGMDLPTTIASGGISGGAFVALDLWRKTSNARD